MQDFFITPIGGLAWNVGEDAIDRFLLSRLRHRTRNPMLLLAASVATPGRSATNLTRLRAPCHRDLDRNSAGLTVHWHPYDKLEAMHPNSFPGVRRDRRP